MSRPSDTDSRLLTGQDKNAGGVAFAMSRRDQRAHNPDDQFLIRVPESMADRFREMIEGNQFDGVDVTFGGEAPALLPHHLRD